MEFDKDISYLYQIYQDGTRCPCGEIFDTQHAMLSKKGGIVNLRHNKLRGITGALLGHFCHNVATEAILQSVTDINFGPSTTNTNDSARLDVGAS